MPALGLLAGVGGKQKKQTMNQKIRAFSIFLFLIIAIDSYGQSNNRQLNLMVGSDEFVSNNCSDSCLIVYKNYTVVTRPHVNACGEDIIITCIGQKIKTIVDLKGEYQDQYFSGLIKDKAIIDVGTGFVRTNYIYDLKKQSLIDSIDNIIDDPKVIDGRLFYSIIVPNEKAKELKLSPCDNPDLEYSGYVEYMYYDLDILKAISSGKYKCIK